ncbi:MAG TPA: 4Fe-4S binding protein, partial [Acidobacteria bacterium]|nr:4Fe-4S binding protein [Acidobacteriota bacterium]
MRISATPSRASSAAPASMPVRSRARRCGRTTSSNRSSIGSSASAAGCVCRPARPSRSRSASCARSCSEMARGGGLRLAEPCGDAGASRPRWTRWRRASQLLFAAFFVLLPVSARWWGQTVVLGTLASLHIGPLALVDPAAGLASILASRSVQLSLLGGMVLPALLALVLGPVFCSWVCPWGLISELLDKLPGRRPRAGARPAGHRRWLWLGGLMLASALLGLPLAALISAPRLITQLPLELIYLGGASVGTVSWLVVL